MSLNAILERFADFCRIDLHLAERTVKNHIYNVKEFLRTLRKPMSDVSPEDVRLFLKRYVNGNPYTYANKVKSLRRFLGDFLGYSWIKTFKIPRPSFKPKVLPSKEELRKFYNALKGEKYKALFLVLASSGLRLGEVLALRWEDVDLEQGLIFPPQHEGSSKRSWVSCINEEAIEALKAWKPKCKCSLIFPVKRNRVARVFREASAKSGVKVTAKTLREWFSSEMAKLGVPDRYIDAFCGRLPRSVLARYYTDYSSERLREIYHKAGLRILK